MQRLPIRFPLFLAGAMLLTLAADARTPAVLSVEEAVQKLSDTVLADNLYSWARQGECLLLTVEFITSTAISVAVRERHEPPCSGDSEAASVVDRFSVGLKTQTISRHDPAADEWLPYPSSPR